MRADTVDASKVDTYINDDGADASDDKDNDYSDDDLNISDDAEC